INSSPHYFAYKDLWGIPGEPPTGEESGCSFHSRCSQALESCREGVPLLQQVCCERRVACHRGGIITILQAEELEKEYRLKKSVIKAVNKVSLHVKEGEVVALVGETGSGKSTVAHMLGRLVKPTNGEITFRGEKFNSSVTRRENGIQIVMQDPFSSTSHRLTVEQALREPLDINKIGTHQERAQRVTEALQRVQLPWGDDFLKRFCFELSGGQRQRTAIARALVMKPALLLADEITSMLDPSTQANLLRLLKGLQNSQGFAMLFITHDLDLARKVADRVMVMKEGEIVESGSSRRLFSDPCCCHTKELMDAAFGDHNQIHNHNHQHHHHHHHEH
ncbi:MAG: ATP-binding cassette domain-containing protein, partial [Candidatus Contubernalis sp.]|nr:ATP-binding cassette domain-containing protein [Candidatus Contubernalis sp.]